jgi:hypothetical protein
MTFAGMFGIQVEIVAAELHEIVLVDDQFRTYTITAEGDQLRLQISEADAILAQPCPYHPGPL